MVETDRDFLLGKLDEIWNEFGEDKTGKGSAFERLMASYLRTAPEFSEQFSEVYLWQDWPERGNAHDHGIDIVAKDEINGGWTAVQCKFYDPQSYVSKKDIDSFLAATAKDKFTGRIVLSTARGWGSNIEKQLDGLTVPVTRIGINDLLESKVDWSQIDWQAPQTYLPLTGKNQLRPHQKQAKDAVINGLATHDRGQLIMACGTGKTFTSLKIAEQLATDSKAKATTVLFLVPSIQLVNQTFREWAQETELPFRAFAVCSDVKVGKGGPKPKDDPEDIAVHDLIIPATTDTKALAAKIKEAHEHDKFTVIFSTYQSIDVVAQAQKDGVPDFDLIIADEAHRTTGVTLADTVESQFVRVHDNSYIKAAKRLYMTATPRLFDPKVKEKADNAAAVLVSMDDESLYGPVLHRLGFGEAVERDLLTDYKVLVLKVDESFVAESFQSELAQSGEIKLEDAAKLIGCWNGLAKRFGDALTSDDLDGDDLTPMKTAVAFAANIKASKAAREAFPSIVDRLISTYAEDEDTDAVRERNRMQVQIRHVDGTMNAVDRGNELAWLKSGAEETDNVCRVLTNVRCLSEGVDVPALDAVMFLTPRGSQVDIVQSVGRVMRKAPGKKLGYIVLPVVVPAGMSPEAALSDNKRFQAVWEVLQALRAHDDRFNAMVNQLDLNTKKNTKITIIDTSGGSRGGGSGDDSTQLTLPFGIEEWRDAIYARIVKKVGERRYWETWAKDVAKIAEQHIARITGLLADPESKPAKEFEAFLAGLRGNLNDGITQTDAVEMLAQHLITRPVFEALFAGYDFAANNPVAQTMERMLAVLDEHSLDAENSELEKFYSSVRGRVEGVDNAEGRQRIIVELYDKFFATAFKRTVDKLGIVYTPVEIVDFILNSADEVLQKHFGQGLTDEGVHILDGFSGTGTFMVRLLQSGLIKPHDLARKYANELHANEILLLAYYIAAVNIETTYQDLIRGSLDEEAAYEPFPGLVLTDTFQSYEHGDEDDLGVFPENNERINRQRKLPITVIVGNPPYSSGQDSANDNNANEKYETLDAAIRDTYAARSTATNKNSLYDSYIRAIKWASLRIKDRGVIAFVTNGGWLDSNTADGMRITLADEFSAIHVFNLRGNQRTAGEQSRKEGGKVFDAGSRATVAVTVLVKDQTETGAATIRYADIGDYLTREEKLAKVAATSSVGGLEAHSLTPNRQGDWLNQRRDDFDSFMPLGSKDDNVPAVVGSHSRGVMTCRDAWAYSFGSSKVTSSMQSTIRFFNELVDVYDGSGSAFFTRKGNSDPGRISWDAGRRREVERGRSSKFDEASITIASYRPFCKEVLYYNREWNESVYRVPSYFPSAHHAENVGFSVIGAGASAPFSLLMTAHIPDVQRMGAGQNSQFFARWRYEKDDQDGSLFDAGDSDVVDGYRRVDNITDEALGRFRAAYQEAFTKDDIFFYVYGLLHSPEYQETYAADLKKMLPRIPLVEDAQPFVDAGRKLSKLHLGYESVTPYPLDGLDVDAPDDDTAYEIFRVEKMAFAKKRDPETKKLVADKSTVIYNDRITLSGIPEDTHRYMLGSRSAVEWILDRYQVKTDKASGIVNDPNDWSREVSDPRYIIDLLARIVTVSLETMKIVDALPPLAIRENQNPMQEK
ncbi:DNA damage-inducible protein [Knoellia subterranea KCTC 19937]|uniref:DNA damage-inducible protein n=1 Tax=Knoellia subterranea KCTC 19937 TaxID=1385521 RepID=A0A0A0JLC2_9MICO|nr:DNA damage-inducible protein [Knoellia subterranea KCTC 19937]